MSSRVPWGMVGFPGCDGWLELRQAWLCGMGWSKIFQARCKAHWLCAGGKFPPSAIPGASAPLPPSAAHSAGMGGPVESLTFSPSCL